MFNKNILIVSLLLFFLNTTSFARKAPEFTFKDIKGKEISLSDFKGKVILINFWATWCGPCIYEMPSLEKLYQTYSKQGLQVIGLTITSNNNQVPSLLSRMSISYPILLDAEEAVESYGPFSAIPQSFLINSKGEIIKEFVGMRSYAQFEKEIKKLL